MDKTSPSKQIDSIIKMHKGWKGDAIKRLRQLIKSVDADINEEIKWKMPSRPEGLPVWTLNGIICYTEIWKDNVKLIFFKGARLKDTHNLFNARLNSSSIRAIEIKEGDSISEDKIKELVLEAVDLNKRK